MRCKKVIMFLFFTWTLFILYGSLAPGDDLPAMGWLAWLPFYDKLIHFGFYMGQVTLLQLWLQPKRQNRIWTALCVIIFSGIIELIQSEYFNRTTDWLDFAANSLGALSGVAVAAFFMRILSRKKNA